MNTQETAVPGAVPQVVGSAATAAAVSAFMAAGVPVPAPVQEAGMSLVEAFGALAGAPDDAAAAAAAEAALGRLDRLLAAG